MKYLRKKVVIISFSILFFSLFNLYSQQSQTQWYIAKIKSGTTINQKEMYGPYDSLETTLATWIYNEVKEDSKYCITKNFSFITSKPSTYYRKQYSDIHKKFMVNMDNAAVEFNVDTENLINKKKKTKKTSEEKNEEVIENESNNTAVIAETEIKEESDTSVEAEKNTEDEVATEEESLEETENVETKIENEKATQPAEYKTAVATYTRPAKKDTVEVEEETPVEKNEEIEKTEENPVKPYTFEIDKSAKVSRYRKEYLQDYIPEDKVIPADEVAMGVQKIENPDKKDNQGKTALMIAAKSGNDWQIKLLIDSNADVNIQDNDGWTALMYAVRYQESTSIVKSLIAADADVRINNNYDSNALIYAACYNNNPEILKLILDNYTISEKDVLKAFAMLLSSKQSSEYIELAKMNVFLERSIPLNSLYNGKTPLMYAAQYAHYSSVIKLLLDNSALTGLRSSEGKTAFEYAVENKNLIHDDIYWSLNKK